MGNPTGQQFEITRGNARAVVTEIGAGLRAFEVGGVPYVEEFPEDAKPPMGAGQVLLPWPNRTKGGRWTFQGETQQLEITEEARGNAIHGLTRHLEWELLEHAESSVTLAVDVAVQAGWPVPLRATITYELAPRELTVTHEIRNEGEQPIGVGVGTHPYFRIGDVPTDEVTLTLPASRVRPSLPDEQMPYAPEQDVEGTEYDFRGGRVLAGVNLDTAFGGLAAAEDGTHHIVLSHGVTSGVPPRAGGSATQTPEEVEGQELLVWTGPDFRWAQVFTPDDLIGRGRAVAIEPMTCPADALNTGTDLIELEPSASWSGSWGVRVR